MRLARCLKGSIYVICTTDSVVDGLHKQRVAKQEQQSITNGTSCNAAESINAVTNDAQPTKGATRHTSPVMLYLTTTTGPC